ncbi:hypothetical protein ACP4OV_028114 [Aristida adscensionis]
MCTAALAPRAALGAAVAPSAPAQKRARNNGVDGGERRVLEERVEAELAAVLGLLKKAELLSRRTGNRAAVVPAAGKHDLGKATRKRKTPPSEPAPAAAAQRKNVPDDKAATATPPPPRETSMRHLMAEAAEARARRRREEIARERERFRRELEEVERAAPPDERISPRELQELGIVAGREYAVTPTKRQAQRRSLDAARAAAMVAATKLP